MRQIDEDIKLTEKECSLVGQFTALSAQKENFRSDILAIIAAQTTRQTATLDHLIKSNNPHIKISVYQNPACPEKIQKKIREWFLEEDENRTRHAQSFFFEIAGFDYERGLIFEEEFRAYAEKLLSKRALFEFFYFPEGGHGPHVIDFVWRQYRSIKNATYILNRPNKFVHIQEKTLRDVHEYYFRRARVHRYADIARFLSFQHCPPDLMHSVLQCISRHIRKNEIWLTIEDSPVVPETTKHALKGSIELSH